MLLSDSPAPARPRLSAGFFFACLLLLSGCIKPLYGPVGAGTLEAELQSIAVDPIPDRLGHYLANELIFAFNGTGTPGPVKYRLLVVPRERVQTALVDTITGRSDASTIIVDADFRLVPAAGGAAIVLGTVTGAATYDRSAQRFSNIRAARDGEIRLSKTLADQIRIRISAALATRS